MNWLFWIGGAALILAIVGAIFFFARNPQWVAGLVKAFVGMAIVAFLPALLKQMPPHEQEAWNKFNRSNPDKRETQRWWKAYRERQKIPARPPE